MAGEITQLLEDLTRGDRAALNRLFPLVYPEMRRLAAACLRHEAGNVTLQPTALVHEAYLRLVDAKFSGFEGRRQFFGMAAVLMRRILVDGGRERAAQKRGSCKTTLREGMAAGEPESVDVLDLDEALIRLEAVHPDLGRVVELRYFGGLSVQETAETLGISTPTVKRRWSTARAWLWLELRGAKRAHRA